MSNCTGLRISVNSEAAPYVMLTVKGTLKPESVLMQKYGPLYCRQLGNVVCLLLFLMLASHGIHNLSAAS